MTPKSSVSVSVFREDGNQASHPSLLAHVLRLALVGWAAQVSESHVPRGDIKGGGMQALPVSRSSVGRAPNLSQLCPSPAPTGEEVKGSRKESSQQAFLHLEAEDSCMAWAGSQEGLGQGEHKKDMVGLGT